MKNKYLPALKQMALSGALQEQIPLSSGELAKKLNVSQQTASQHILYLLKEGLVERAFGRRKQYLRITKKGLKELRREYADYIRFFGGENVLTIKGRIVSGMGEGRYYISQRGYKRQFKSLLGLQPYEGTLNIRLEKSEMIKLDMLESGKSIVLKGFKEGQRTFGDVKAFKSTIQGLKSAIILPARTHYTDVLEIISEEHLRTVLGLGDDDEVELKVDLS